MNRNDIFSRSFHTTPLWACGATPYGGSRPSDSFLWRSEGASTGFMVASGGVLSEGYGHSGPGVRLGNGQTEAYLKDMGMASLASVWVMATRKAILKDMGMTGLSSAWAMARRRPKEYSHKVDAATRCSGV